MAMDDLIRSVHSEIARLQRARALPEGAESSRARVTFPVRTKHNMSAEGRAKIAAAQRKRWAVHKEAAKK